VFYFVYSRLCAHVSWDDARLMAALDEWADGALKGGREALTDAVRVGVRAEHMDAQALYAAVMGGRL
jgi:hypothetical protein